MTVDSQPMAIAELLQARLGVEVPEIAALCDHYRIRKLSFFGSVLRDDFHQDSDIDILVEFEPGQTPGFAFIMLQDGLSALLGRQVDLNTSQCLSRYFRDRVLSEAAVIYERS